MSESSTQSSRRRLAKQDRHAQLLAVARELIRADGTQQFTLALLAERAGVSKPVAYDHFGDRSGVLVELYRTFEERQLASLNRALDDTDPTLEATSRTVASAYIDCFVTEGREMSDVVSALAGSPALDRIRQEASDAYLRRCGDALSPHSAGPIAPALRAIVGAGDALGRSVVCGQIDAADARLTLTRVVVAVTAGTESSGPES